MKKVILILISVLLCSYTFAQDTGFETESKDSPQPLISLNKGKYFKEDTEDSFTYRFVMPVILNKRPRVLVINAIGNSLDILQNLNEVTLYEIR